MAKNKSAANQSHPLSAEELRKIDAYWRAANYLSVGQIYLLDNPLLNEPLELRHIKPCLLGRWATTPALNFIYAHLNRIIQHLDLNVIFLAGPDHGVPALIANTYLEGTYSEFYPDVSQDTQGMQQLFRQFSFPGGIGSHATPEIPGSIHAGGELGYVLSHAFGAVFDNPDLIAACIVGDGEAETGPLATAWHANKFLNPVHDGAVLPILHLNGYKIANPTILACISREELMQLFQGYGYHPYMVEEGDTTDLHQQMAHILDQVVSEIRTIQQQARQHGNTQRPRWPLIILRTPKGWTGPKEVVGQKMEDNRHSHQLPLANLAKQPEGIRQLEQWLKSYRPEELFDANGRLIEELRALAPIGKRRMSANCHANGGLLLKQLRLPDFRNYAVELLQPGQATTEATPIMGRFLRDVMQANLASRNFRAFGSDGNISNSLRNLFEVTQRTWLAETLPDNEHLAPDGRVMEILSEHTCQGWLEGYLLTGRHGLLSCTETFLHIVYPMFNQHAKWLKVSKQVPWRRSIASLNYLLTSHVWCQDHNSFMHQNPSFIDHVVNKNTNIARVYLPPDANCLLYIMNKCLRSCNFVNVIVAGKQAQSQWLNMDAAIKHCAAGIGIWDWASNDQGNEPDVVIACAGDVPTIEALAAVSILWEYVPDLRVRLINVVDLMTLQPEQEHPQGLSDRDFDTLFTTDKPIIFAYHGSSWLIHYLTYRRTNHRNLHVRGYKEDGPLTTLFDMVVRNDLDRFHLVNDVIDWVPKLGYTTAYLKQIMHDKLIEHHEYIHHHGEDMPEIRNWKWTHL